MQKLNKVFSILAAVSLLFLAFPTFAQKPVESGQSVLPEQAGVYDVAGKPHLKLKVFVYHGKPADKPGKPLPPSPVEVCASSTVADPNSDSVAAPTGWNLPASWTYELNSASVPPTVGGANLSVIASNAFAEWQGAVNNTVNFSPSGEITINKAQLDNHNLVTWGRTSNGALAVTYTWYNRYTSEVAEVDTIMNQKYPWRWSNPAAWPAGQMCAFSGAYDAQAILTHELGHWMGLDDHYTDGYQNNTMYGYGYKADAKSDTLTVGDIAGVRAIYIK